jgi:predicted SAM-dependent methyltransferase
MQKLGLNIGSGPCHLDSTDEMRWMNTDIRDDMNWELEANWDFMEPIPLEDNSVDFILAHHVFEHVSLNDRMAVLKDWFRILKPSGKLAISVPNIPKLMQMWTDGEFHKEEGDPWFRFMVNIYGPYNGIIGDLHKWGYSDDELRKVLGEAGFSNISDLNEANVPGELYRFTLGQGHERKVVLAPWALQFLCIK